MLEIRLATLNDSQDIFEWRNDLTTRQMSHDPKVIPWDVHKAWFKATMENRHQCLLICTNNQGEKIGVIRFDIEGNTATISLNLNPKMRGKGLAIKCLGSAIKFAQTSFSNLNQLTAEVKKTNKASKKTFEGVGFVFIKERDGVQNYRMLL